MKYDLIDSYKNTVLSPKDSRIAKNRINITFTDGPRVEILGDNEEEYQVSFIDRDTSKLIYSSTIKNNMWTAVGVKYYVNWSVIVKRKDEIIDGHDFNLSGRNVKIILDTQSIGDLFAYIGAVSEFQKKWACQVHCVVFQPELFALFKNSYSNLKFVSVNERDEDYYAVYRIGWFNEWEGRLSKSPQQMCLANIASDVLGFKRRDFKPVISFKRLPKPAQKYVCIGMQSTAQFKYWNNPKGWDEVVAYLNKLGYEVWCIDRHSSFGTAEHQNHMPKGCVDKTGNYSLEERLAQLANADFFIGLSSGLSWMAWTVNIPVILISGIGEPWTEFFTPHRIINKSVCHSCTNDVNHRFEKDNWMYCPRNKNFECTREISSKMVIDEIDKLQTDFYRVTMHNFDWGQSTTPEKELIHREIFKENTYARVFDVQEGDVVMDIGAHVGVFSIKAIPRKPKMIVAVEPSVIRVPALKNNLKGCASVIVSVGLGSKREFIKNGLVYDSVVEDFNLAPMEDIMKEAGIDKVDYLKTDCEGGEYNLLTAENFEWVSRNIKRISGEAHLEDAPRKEAFRKFRDTYLTKLDPSRYTFHSVDGVDIKWDLFNEHFIEYYQEVIFTIDNTATFQRSPDAIKHLAPIVAKNSTPQVRQGLPLVTAPDFYENLFNLEGKVAIVTGAGGHLGAAMVMGLISRGAVVYAVDRSVEKVKEKLFTPENHRKSYIVPIACDISNENMFQSMINIAVKMHGKIDILVNNAFSEKRKPFEELTTKDWREGMDGILTTQFSCARMAIKQFKAQGSGGSIVNVGSIYGFIATDQRAYQEVPSSTVFYTAAKAGAIQMTKELAVQYATQGIRVNSISPGHFPKPPANPANANPRYVAGLAQMVPMQRVGCADEIAGAVVFLSSPAAAYVTGHNLVIDGGRTVW